MKRFFMCALLLVFSICTLPSAQALTTDYNPGKAPVRYVPSKDSIIDFDYFIYWNYWDDFGYASTDPIYASVSSEDYSNTWAKRTGVFGYDTADMNGDGVEDLLVYSFSYEGNDNAIMVDYYAFDNTADIIEEESWTINIKDEHNMEYHAGAVEYCVGGIIKKNGQNCLLIEIHYTPYPAVDYHISYWVLSSSKSGGMELSNYVLVDDGYMNTVVGTSRGDGTYLEEYYSLSSYGLAGLKTGLLNIGLPNSPVSSSNIGNTLGRSTTDMFYTYFNTNFEKRSFYMLSDFEGYSNNYKTLNFVNIAGMYPKQELKKGTILVHGKIYGDLDADNKITSADSLLVLRASVNLEKLSYKQMVQSDVNDDGAVDSADSLEVLRYSVGLSDNRLINQPLTDY